MSTDDLLADDHEDWWVRPAIRRERPRRYECPADELAQGILPPMLEREIKTRTIGLDPDWDRIH